MEILLSHCAQAFTKQSGMLITFFMGGVTGGFTHCLTMCGQLVASHVACKRPCATKRCGLMQTIGHVTGISYHLGRFTTYGALGFLTALFSQQLAASNWWPKLSSLMLGLAGLLFLFSCFKPCFHRAHSTKSFGLIYLRGTLLGFMPCGLLYAALMMAATLADPVQGMFAMLLFTLGTLPALWIASGSAELLSRKWQHVMQRIGRAMMALNGLSLLVMAGNVTG